MQETVFKRFFLFCNFKQRPVDSHALMVLQIYKSTSKWTRGVEVRESIALESDAGKVLGFFSIDFRNSGFDLKFSFRPLYLSLYGSKLNLTSWTSQ